MLQLIFNAIPNIIAAAVLLGIGYLISKFVVQIIKEILPGLGVDRALAESGLVSEGTTASGIIARVVQVAIILFFAIACILTNWVSSIEEFVSLRFIQGISLCFIGAVGYAAIQEAFDEAERRAIEKRLRALGLIS